MAVKKKKKLILGRGLDVYFLVVEMKENTEKSYSDTSKEIKCISLFGLQT